MNCDANTLVSAAACLEQQIPPGFQNAVIIYLLCQIVNNGGTGGGAGVTTGNYAGAQPNFTPTTSGGVAIDNSNGRIWWWFNGVWN